MHPDQAAAPVPTWRRWLFPGLALVATLAALAAFWAARQVALTGQSATAVPPSGGTDGFVGAVVQPPSEAPDFTFPTADGGTFRLEDARGKAVVLFFGFTSCPDVCPNTLTQLAVGLRELGPLAEDVVPVFVSVDPARDTPAIVAPFLEGYDDRVVGLVPDEEALSEVAEAYGVVYYREYPGGVPTESLQYTMTHTASLFLIDPDGRLRAALVPPYTPSDIAHDVRLLLGGEPES